MSTILPKYDGEKKGAWLRHGTGKYTYEYEGFSYDGDWEDGSKHGDGKFTLPDGSVYEGAWAAGKRHGLGTLTSQRTALLTPAPAARPVARAP